VRAGGIVAYPTEAVFGLGCDPFDWFAVERILQLKQRSVEKGLILIAADFEQLRPFVRSLSDRQMRIAFESWPGPHTWLLPAAAAAVPPWIRGDHDSVAVRVTAHPVAAALCRACGFALVSTSANLSDRPPARSALGVRLRFGDRVDCILSGSVGPDSGPTPIQDLATGRVVRG
jgi:L-threonylcarbamoyladenylate synthase